MKRTKYIRTRIVACAMAVMMAASTVSVTASADTNSQDSDTRAAVNETEEKEATIAEEALATEAVTEEETTAAEADREEDAAQTEEEVTTQREETRPAQEAKADQEAKSVQEAKTNQEAEPARNQIVNKLFSDPLKKLTGLEVGKLPKPAEDETKKAEETPYKDPSDIDNPSDSRSIISAEYGNRTIIYHDDFFRYASSNYNQHLATASIIMTENSAEVSGRPKSADDTEWYENQSKALRGYFDAIGFTDFETNEDFRMRTDFDTIGVAAARRQVDDSTVIAVSIRSGSYFREWSNNVWLGDGSKSDYMHEGWYNAANKVIAFLKEYVSSRDIRGRVKIWLTGFSRGGATANLTAGLLDNMIDKNEIIFTNGAALKHDDLYTYTFEAPQGANFNSVTVKKPGDAIYNNIWNVINPNDLVTKVAMSEYGFTRFGTDKYITTKFYDPDHFKDNRNTVKYYYEKMGGDFSSFKGDSFTMYGIPASSMIGIAMNPASLGLYYLFDKTVYEKDERKANYDANMVSTMILEEMVKYIGSREDYCKNHQNGMRDLLYYLMDDVNGDTVDLLKGTIKDSLIALFGLGNKEGAYKVLKSGLPKDTAESIASELVKLVGVCTCIYVDKPNELLSFVLQADNVIANHDTKINIAHLQAQDSNYLHYFTPSDNSKIVPLRDNADFGRMTMKDFNQIGLFLNDGGSPKNVVDVKGYSLGRSDIKTCKDGFAVGYYSYMTEEAMEVFMPADHNYIINMESFSKKFSHEVNWKAVYYHVGPNQEGTSKIELDSFSKTVCLGSGFIQKGASMKR